MDNLKLFKSFLLIFSFLGFLSLFSATFAQDHVEFSFDEDTLTDGPQESLAPPSIDSKRFDQAFRDKVAKKKLKGPTPSKFKKIVSKPVSGTKASRPQAQQAIATDSMKIKKTQESAVAPSRSNTSHVPASKEKTSSAEDYWKKMVKIVKKGYHDGKSLALEWGKKLKMKWDESRK